MPSLQAFDRFGPRDLNDGISNRVVFDVNGVRRSGGGNVAQRGPLGWNDRLLGLVKLRREQPEFTVVDVKLPLFLANAALAENQDLFAVTQRVDDDRPFFKCDM